jgi:hypothetical protein
MTLKNLDLDARLKEDLRNLAWASKMRMSEYVASIVQGIADGDVVVQPRQATKHDATVKYQAPDGYEAALSAAQAAGATLAEAIRDELAARALQIPK